MPAALGARIGGGVLLLIMGLRGVTVDPTRPPSRADRAAAAIRSPALAGRILAAAAVGAVTLVLTRWPVAAAGMAALVVLWPKLFGGSNAEQRQIAALEALVTWTDSLRDTIAAHAGLEHAIPASTVNAPPLIRPSLVRLVGQIRARVPMDKALLNLAAELDDPSADLVIAALILNTKRRGDRLGDVLTGLATAAREELEMRRKIFAGRAQLRRGVQIVIAVTIAFAVFLVVFSRDYIAPYWHTGRAGRAGGRGRHLRGRVRLDAQAVRAATGGRLPGPARGGPRPGRCPAAGHPGRRRPRRPGGW